MFLELTRKKEHYITINLNQIITFDKTGIHMANGTYYPFSVIDQDIVELNQELRLHKLMIQPFKIR